MNESAFDLAQPCTQEAFGQLVGVSQQAISDLVAKGVLEPGTPAGVWLTTYCKRLRDQASGRDADGVLAKERAALSRSQRMGQDIKNAKDLGEWAPIGLLGDVLALASAAVCDRFDALPAALRKACPDMPGEARDAILRVLTSARAEWIRSTAQLVDQVLDAHTEDESTAEDPPAEPDDEGP